MIAGARMQLGLLSTGVPGLDDVLGGGLPEFSFNLVAGSPGSGKTTLVHQLAFANATAERPALYFTVLGEPPIKMLRYQQQMGFFDVTKVGTAVRFIDLSAVALAGDLAALLGRIAEVVKATNPSIVVVDSFRTVVQARDRAALDARGFLSRLAQQLTSWEVTSFLIGEYSELEATNDPVFTIADGILWLAQSREGNSIVRKLEVMKLRGREAASGLHTFRITSEGVRVFFHGPFRTTAEERAGPVLRLSTGVPGLDLLLGGGIPQGDVTLIAGPSGTGKTALCTQFVAAGVKQGEAGVIAVFEEKPDEYLARALELGLDLPAMVRAGKLRVVHLHSPGLSAVEIAFGIREAADEIGARRLVVDSLNGLELALAPNFRDDFREALYRLVGGLTSGGVTVLLTVEVAESFDQLRFSPHGVSFLAQNILFLRYAELRGRLEKILAIIKMRRSAHARELITYEIDSTGVRIIGPLTGYAGILTGNPTPSCPPGTLSG